MISLQFDIMIRKIFRMSRANSGANFDHDGFIHVRLPSVVATVDADDDEIDDDVDIDEVVDVSDAFVETSSEFELHVTNPGE